MIPAKEFRKLSIDELLKTVEVAVDVLDEKYREVIRKYDASVILSYREWIGYIGFEVLKLIYDG